MSWSLDPSIGRPAPRWRCEWCGDDIHDDDKLCADCAASDEDYGEEDE